ncbi:MAG: hypothetical protein LBN26_01300 [Christensenellaceae bacterium]|jgi:hypothetical protein|nr:hypothetical protein [Christensenellaceae bacterium]
MEEKDRHKLAEMEQNRRRELKMDDIRVSYGPPAGKIEGAPPLMLPKFLREAINQVTESEEKT